ncbi:MAG: hypothetical protein LBH65_03225 [Desulfovibrio sp.]|jgi:capsular polysaccharide export protein|nr:hypothetical protein [Desulfovibrio sp.]
MLRKRGPFLHAAALALHWALHWPGRVKSRFERKHALTFQRIRDILLEMHAEKRAALSFDIPSLASPKEALLTFDKEEAFGGELRDKDSLLRVFGAGRFVFLQENADMPATTGFFHILRNSRIKKQIFLLLAALRGAVDLYFVETGFVSRTSNIQDASIPPVHRRSCSWIVDDMAFYYDALVPSRIERFLNSKERVLQPEEKERAGKIIALLRERKITKYNYQPFRTPDILRLPGKKVLVADQSLRDASITRGMANERSFADMLDAAIAENPDAYVIIKTHPNSLTKGRGSYYGKVRENGRIHKLTEIVNPWCVLEAVDKVYVCTSQIGLEAMMCDKETHCFGMPVYAGWGLTKDRVALERRKEDVTLEELVHALYVRFSVYIHPENGDLCAVEEYVEALLKLRDDYFSLQAKNNHISSG